MGSKIVFFFGTKKVLKSRQTEQEKLMYNLIQNLWYTTRQGLPESPSYDLT
jgi:hypothetical protein